MNSPFLFDTIAKKESFFGRNDELAKLEQITNYSNNALLFSKRRMGKTTLIKNFLENKQDKFLTIYVDIFDITSKEDFASHLLKALSNANRSDIKTTIKTFTNLFKRVRVEPTIDPNTLEYSIKPIVTSLTFEQMIEDFFHSIDELSKKQQIIIAIDEFQQIATIKDVKLDALLRKYIQERENTSYIFLGLKRHLLTSLFSYQAPLFELAQHFELLSLQTDEIFMYAKKYLNISKDNIEYIFDICDGETKLILHILHILYINKDISKDSINEALKNIINSKDTTFRMLFDTLNNNQKLALKIIAQYTINFYSQDILIQYNIKKQTLKSAIDALLVKEMIDKVENRYFIPDRSFELWIKSLGGK